MGMVRIALKGLFLLFNFVFWAMGLALLVVGVLAKVQFQYIVKLATDIDYNIAPYIMIGCGVFILLLGFMGCWGSIKEHGWALKLYMFVLIVLFVAEVVGAIAGYVLRGKLDKSLQNAFNNGIASYHTNKDIEDAVDMLQEQIGCCGANSFTDYFTPPPTKSGNTTSPPPQKGVPKSCCLPASGAKCNYASVTADMKPANATIYTKGCYPSLLAKTKENVLIIVGVSLGIAIFQVLGVVTAFKLTQRFKKNYEKM